MGFVTDTSGIGLTDGLYFRGTSVRVWFAAAGCGGQAYVAQAEAIVSNEVYWADKSSTLGDFYTQNGGASGSFAVASYALGGACTANANTLAAVSVYKVGSLNVRASYPWTIKVE